MIKIPSDKILQYIDDTYSYDTYTGIVSKDGEPVGSKRKKDGRIVLSIRYSKLADGTQLHYTTYAYQVAWYLTYGVWPNTYIDHINGDPADNRLSNLRPATTNQNQHNVAKGSKLTTSKYKGVTRVGSKWRAYISWGGKVRHLGYHATEEQAALAYDTIALKVFGGYARCNFGANSAISGEWKQLELPFAQDNKK